MGEHKGPSGEGNKLGIQMAYRGKVWKKVGGNFKAATSENTDIIEKM